MNIRDHSSQFTVYVFTLNVDQGAAAKVYLSQAGYDAYFFQDPSILEERLKENPPHLLVFSTAGLSGALNDFVNHVLDINQDIKFIALSPAEQFEILAQYNSHGFVDVVSEDPTALESRIVWAVDRACEKIYLTFQNEQLFDDLQAAKKQVTEVHAAAMNSLKVAPAEPEERTVVQESPRSAGPSVTIRIADYKSSQSKEDLIQRFLNNLTNVKAVYFKYLPSVRSFVATHASLAMEVTTIQGVGCQLDNSEVRDLGGQLAVGLLPVKFSQIVVDAFHFESVRCLPLYVQSHLEGVLVYSGQAENNDILKVSEEFSLVSLCYSHFALERKVDALEVQDFVTEVYNRNYYLKVINEEAARTRRMKQPLSLVKIALDDFYEIESSLGEAVRDELLKSIATVINKTGRTNDVVCRTGVNEFALILPNCSKKGAALRAERLRRIVEGTTFVENGVKISISLGVSEFPTLCDSAKSLDESATKALGHIVDKGGNKICLFKAPGDYTPEFEVPAE